MPELHPNDTLAQTGPGIPDDAAADGYDPVVDAEMEHDLETHPLDAQDLFDQGKP